MGKKIDPRSVRIRVRSRHLLLAFGLCVLLSQGVQAMSRQFLSTPEQAEAFVGMLLGEKADSLEGAYELTPDMEQAVTASGGWAGLAKSLSALGDPVSIGPAYADVWKGRDVLRVPCTFSMARADLVFVLEKGAIGGLVTDYYTGAQETPAEETPAEEALPEEDRFTEMSLSVPISQLDASLQGGQTEETADEASDEPPLELPGTLTIPEGEGPFPAIVLVHGSGPCDRDETIMNQKPFKDLAESLAEQGIAVFRYDKRTYVYRQEMAGDFRVTLMEETIEDAAAAVRVVSGQERIDPSKIFVLGHSLGAMAVPAIRKQLEKEGLEVSGFILMAPPARTLEVLMREQVEYLYSLLPEITDEQQQEKEALFEELDKLEHLDELPDETAIAGAYVPYWRWLRSYDALAEAEEISEPCLLLQGEEDYQVTMEDFRMWQEAFGDHPGWKLVSCPGLVHTFAEGEKKEGPEAYARDAHVDGQVIRDVAAFVLAAGDAPAREADDLAAQTQNYEIDRIYTAGDLSLKVISVTIDRSAWIDENGAENPGCTIDVYYQMSVREGSDKEVIAYDLTEGRLTADGKEYTLRNVFRSMQDEPPGRNRTAEPGNDWHIYCRSFCLMQEEAEGKRSFPELRTDTPMELQMVLEDITNGTESTVRIRVNE